MIAGTALIGVAAGLVLLWQASEAIIVILVSAIIAVALHSAAAAAAQLISVSREAALVAIILILVAATGLGLWWGGAGLAEQFQAYAKAVRGVLISVQDYLNRGADGLFPPGSLDLDAAMPRFATVFLSATKVATLAAGATVNFILIVFLSVFFAWSPHLYRAGFLAVVPPDHKATAARALNRAGDAIRHWIGGQAVSMVVVFIATLVALLIAGMPYAIVLALLAGLLSFIPTIGPLLSGVAIVIAGFSVSATMALYGFAIYLLVQFVETYLITPLVQQRAIHLPPAATLGAQLVIGAIFGPLGFAFAVPLAAAAKALVLELWVEPMHRPSAAPVGV